MAKSKYDSAMKDLFADPSTPVSAAPTPATNEIKVQSKFTSPGLTPEQRAASEANGAENLGEGERYLKDSEVAIRFGIARQTVWKRVERGYLPTPIKLPPNSTRWRLSSLLTFEKALAKLQRQSHQKNRKSRGTK